MEAFIMRIKSKNVTRLASLSALGAGALGVAAGTAQAGIIYSNVGLPAVVGANNAANWVANLPVWVPTIS